MRPTRNAIIQCYKCGKSEHYGIVDAIVVILNTHCQNRKSLRE